MFLGCHRARSRRKALVVTIGNRAPTAVSFRAPRSPLRLCQSAPTGRPGESSEYIRGSATRDRTSVGERTLPTGTRHAVQARGRKGAG